jgi:hypothetical protein
VVVDVGEDRGQDLLLKGRGRVLDLDGEGEFSQSNAGVKICLWEVGSVFFNRKKERTY